MKEELFNVAIKEEGESDYTGRYRVLQVVPVSFPLNKRSHFASCYLLVVMPNRELRVVSVDRCQFLGF